MLRLFGAASSRKSVVELFPRDETIVLFKVKGRRTRVKQNRTPMLMMIVKRLLAFAVGCAALVGILLLMARLTWVKIAEQDMAKAPKRRYVSRVLNDVYMEEDMFQEIENTAFDQVVNDRETMESETSYQAGHDMSALALSGEDIELWDTLDQAVNQEPLDALGQNVPVRDLLTETERNDMVVHQKISTLAPIGPSVTKTASPTPKPTPFGQGGFPSFDPSFIFQPRPPERDNNNGLPQGNEFPSSLRPSETRLPGQGSGVFAVPPGFVLVPAQDPTPPLTVPSGFVLVPAPPPSATPVVPSGFVLVPISQLQESASSTATTIPGLSGIGPGQSVIVLNEEGEQISIQSLGSLADGNIQPAPSFANEQQPGQPNPFPIASPTFVPNFGNAGNGLPPSPQPPSRGPQTIAFVPQAPTLSIPFVFSTARPFGSLTNNEEQSSSAQPSQTPDVEQAAAPNGSRPSPEPEPETSATLSTTSAAPAISPSPAASADNQALELVTPLINVLPDDVSRFGQELESSTAALQEQLLSMLERSGIPELSPMNCMVEECGSSGPVVYGSEGWPPSTSQDVHWDYELQQRTQLPSQSAMSPPILPPYSDYLKSEFSNLPEDFFNLDESVAEAVAKTSDQGAAQLPSVKTDTSPESFTELSSGPRGPEAQGNPPRFQNDATRQNNVSGYSEISSRLSLSKPPANEERISGDHLVVESSEVVSSSVVESETESCFTPQVECGQPCPTSHLHHARAGGPSRQGHTLRQHSPSKSIGKDKVKSPGPFGLSKQQRRRLCERNALCASPAGQTIRFQDIPFAPE